MPGLRPRPWRSSPAAVSRRTARAGTGAPAEGRRARGRVRALRSPRPSSPPPPRLGGRPSSSGSVTSWGLGTPRPRTACGRRGAARRSLSPCRCHPGTRDRRARPTTGAARARPGRARSCPLRTRPPARRSRRGQPPGTRLAAPAHHPDTRPPGCEATGPRSWCARPAVGRRPSPRPVAGSSRALGSGRLCQLVECCQHCLAGLAGSVLEVLHGGKRRVVAPDGRAKHAVFEHPDVVVPLVSVSEGVVHADVGQPADQQQGLHVEASQQDLEVGAEEARVAPFGDEVVTLAWAELLDEFGARVALQTMDALLAVQLPTEVHEVSTVDLLGEDDRYASGPAGVNHSDDPLHLLGEARHERDPRLLEWLVPALLHVDHDEGRSALNQRRHGVSLERSPSVGLCPVSEVMAAITAQFASLCQGRAVTGWPQRPTAASLRRPNRCGPPSAGADDRAGYAGSTEELPPGSGRCANNPGPPVQPGALQEADDVLAGDRGVRLQLPGRDVELLDTGLHDHSCAAAATARVASWSCSSLSGLREGGCCYLP